MKHTMLAMLVMSTLSSGAFAAKFTAIKKHKDAKLDTLSKVFSASTKDEKIFGDCGSIQSFKIEKKKTEANLNTMKQLNISRGGIWHSEGETTYSLKPKNTFSPTRSLLSSDSDNDWLDEDQRKVFEAAVEAVANAIYDATNGLKDKTKEFYTSSHSNEDGTWSILEIYDTKNQEVLLMQAGFCGT